MLAYTLRRLLIAIPVFLGITLLGFIIATTNPDGGPLTAYLGHGGGGSYTNQQIDAIKHRLGLDQPVLVRYVIWLKNLVRGDLGYSIITHRSVGDSIHDRLIPTLLLMGLAFLLREMLAIPVGVISALRPGSLFDQIATILAYIFFALPIFWFSLMAIVVFSGDLQWFPFGGMVDLSQTGSAFGTGAYWDYFQHHSFAALIDLAHHLTMPVIILGTAGFANDSRFVRASMLEVLNQDFIRTARAKGLTRRTIIWKHAMRNGLLPIVTNIGLELPGLIGGAVIIEQIFSLPGMGSLFIDAAQSYDYPVVIAILILIGGLTLLFNILTDLAYAFVDPRIRYS
jgi:peptide/nickel transport system permease protein